MNEGTKNTVINAACLLIGLLAVLRFVTVPVESAAGTVREHPCAKNPNLLFQGVPCSAVLAAGESYNRKVRRILELKCYDCHGVVERMPLYSKIPPVKGLIQKDIRRAKSEFNLSAGFPFMGKKDFVEDLHELQEVVEEGEMPPLEYKAMHWKSGLTPEEQQKILAWAKNVEGALRAARSVSSAQQ